ncbi:MAG: ACP S-malonyltransferase [Acidimicrobiales bacterium]
MLAFTFPGQGSQRPGMGAPWVDHPSFELVGLASEVTGRDLAHLLLEADQETLTRTDNAQIATFVQSLVVLDAAERLGIEPSAAAGHSLGEYTALVAAGSLDFEDGLRLVSERGAAMQEAAECAPGTMIAVLGLDDESVETACRRVDGEAWIANFNAPGQVIVAGTSEALDELSAIAKELGAKRVLSMPVGGAFHTPLMASARDRLRKALATTSFHSLDPMVVANVDARPHGDPEEWPQLLSAQLCSPVRWRQSLDTLFGEGMQTFVELGPGGVLTGLLRRAAPTTDTVGLSVSTPDELARLVRILAGNTSGTAPTGELFEMTERLIVSPAVGLFEPAAGLNGYLPGSGAPGGESVFIEVGELLGLVGGTEVRSAFSGSLEGVLVLAGERVTRGQPVAWLRARASADRAVQGDRAGQTDSSPPESQPVKDWAVDDGAGREARSFQDERTA